MLDVAEQLARYGAALDREARLRKGSLASDDVNLLVEPGMITESPPRRTGSRVMLAASAFLIAVLVVGVLVTLRSANDEAGPEPVGPPRGQPVARLRIESGPELTYQTDVFTTAPGINEIEFVASGFSDSFAFDDPALSYVELDGNLSTTAKADLIAGRNYRVGSVLAGHRAAGRVATIHVVYRRPPKASPDAEALLVTGTLGSTTWLVTKSGTTTRGSITTYVNGIPTSALAVEPETWKRPTSGSFTVSDSGRAPIRVVSGFAPCATDRVQITFADGSTAERPTRRMSAPFRFFALGTDSSAQVTRLAALDREGEVIADATPPTVPVTQVGQAIPPLQVTNDSFSPAPNQRRCEAPRT